VSLRAPAAACTLTSQDSGSGSIACLYGPGHDIQPVALTHSTGCPMWAVLQRQASEQGRTSCSAMQSDSNERLRARGWSPAATQPSATSASANGEPGPPWPGAAGGLRVAAQGLVERSQGEPALLSADTGDAGESPKPADAEACLAELPPTPTSRTCSQDWRK
jgi:hypothetical protein